MSEQVERLTMSVPEAARELGISSKKAYDLTRMVGFPAFRVGTRVRVSREGLREWVAARCKEEVARAHM